MGKISSLLFLLGLPIFWLSLAQADTQKEWEHLIAEARREGKIVVSGGVDPEVRQQLPAKFKAQFGIPMEYIGGRDNELYARIRSERRSGLYTMDVALSGSETSATVLYGEKMLDPLRPLLLPEVLKPSEWKGGKPWFFDPEERYILHLFRYVSSPLTINTRLVKREEIRSIRDLLASRWKGKISAEDPAVPGQGASVASALHLILGEEFVKRLYLGQQVVLTRNRRQLEDWLVRGVYPISFGIGGSSAQQLLEEGFPVENVLGLPDMPGYYGGGGQSKLCVFHKAPHPNAARLFANWMASKEGLEAYARALLLPTTRVDVDESFVPPHLLPKPGVDYVDTGTWDVIVKHKVMVIRKMAELMKERKPVPTP